MAAAAEVQRLRAQIVAMAERADQAATQAEGMAADRYVSFVSGSDFFLILFTLLGGSRLLGLFFPCVRTVTEVVCSFGIQRSKYESPICTWLQRLLKALAYVPPKKTYVYYNK